MKTALKINKKESNAVVLMVHDVGLHVDTMHNSMTRDDTQKRKPAIINPMALCRAVKHFGYLCHKNALIVYKKATFTLIPQRA